MIRFAARLATISGSILAIAGGALAQNPPGTHQPATEHKAGDLPGPIDNLQDLQDAGKMLFKMADENNDDQISQKEAIDAGNLLVGGFFFRADKNGDGVLSQDEAKDARESLFAQQPVLRYVLTKAKWAAQNEARSSGSNSQQDPGVALMAIVDTNNDKQIQATEVRQAVQTVVQALYAAADTNRDNQLNPSEINAAIVGMVRTAGQALFKQADADHNGQLSRAEFDKMIVEPANVAFAIIDVNNDGQISQQEADRARDVIGHQLHMLIVPEPPNSIKHMLQTGTTPDQNAPVPNFGTPNTRR